MSAKQLGIASGIISLLSLIALFYGLYLFDTHLITDRAEVFMLPAWGCITASILLIISAFQ